MRILAVRKLHHLYDEIHVLTERFDTWLVNVFILPHNDHLLNADDRLDLHIEISETH